MMVPTIFKGAARKFFLMYLINLKIKRRSAFIAKWVWI